MAHFTNFQNQLFYFREVRALDAAEKAGCPCRCMKTMFAVGEVQLIPAMYIRCL